MAITQGDLVAGWSTLYQTLFEQDYNKLVAVEQAQLNPLIMEIPLDDNMGNTVTLDWLGAAPQMQQWADEIREQGLGKNEWTVKPLRYEASVAIDIDVLRDARGNIYVPRLQEMTANAARLRYNLISALISSGTTAKCYDGSNFFDTTHQDNANVAQQANKFAASGTSQAQVTNDYYAAKQTMCSFLDDKGAPINSAQFRPLVWIPNNAALEQAFRNLQGATMISNTSNVLANSFDLVIDPKLAGTSWYMFRASDPMRPFIVCRREEANYRDTFAALTDDVIRRRKGLATVQARMGATYGLWQKAVMIQ
jgi:phage major head subunit gpT-like protein